MSKQEILKSAAKHFASNKDHKSYHVSPDGMCFEGEMAKHNATQHCVATKQNADEVTEVSRGDVSDLLAEKAEKTAPLNVAKTVELINAATTEDEVKAIVGEDTRKGVTDAGAAKIASLAAGK